MTIAIKLEKATNNFLLKNLGGKQLIFSSSENVFTLIAFKLNYINLVYCRYYSLIVLPTIVFLGLAIFSLTIAKKLTIFFIRFFTKCHRKNVTQRVDS